MSNKIALFSINLLIATVFSDAKYSLINTIASKYATKPSHANRGTKIVHQETSKAFSSFMAKRMLNTKAAVIIIANSNTVRRNHLVNSRNVKSMSSPTLVFAGSVSVKYTIFPTLGKTVPRKKQVQELRTATNSAFP